MLYKLLSIIYMKGKYIPFLVLPLLALGLMLNSSAGVYGNGQETCPKGSGWVKIDNLKGLTYTYTAPEGKLVSRSCYKAGTQVIYEDYDPPTPVVTLLSTVQNPQGKNYQDLSHASFKITDEPEYEVCVETKREEGEWSDWEVDPQDPTREYRQRTIEFVDAEDSTISCGSTVETEYRDIVIEEEEEEEDDDGDVMGEGDVKGTSVVMAKTGAGDNLLVYIIQSLLSLSTLASGVVFAKRYIM